MPTRPSPPKKVHIWSYAGYAGSSYYLCCVFSSGGAAQMDLPKSNSQDKAPVRHVGAGDSGPALTCSDTGLARCKALRRSGAHGARGACGARSRGNVSPVGGPVVREDRRLRAEPPEAIHQPLRETKTLSPSKTRGAQGSAREICADSANCIWKERVLRESAWVV